MIRMFSETLYLPASALIKEYKLSTVNLFNGKQDKIRKGGFSCQDSRELNPTDKNYLPAGNPFQTLIKLFIKDAEKDPKQRSLMKP